MRNSIRAAVAACVLVAAGMLGACAQLQAIEQNVQNTYAALSTAQVNYSYVAAGVASFEGLQKIGETYLRLPTCTASGGPICHDRRATAPIKAAFIAGRQARSDVLAYMDAHPCADGGCPLMPNGVYAGLQTAISELQSLYSTYKVNAGAQ